jgi:hypothetical protein
MNKKLLSVLVLSFTILFLSACTIVRGSGDVITVQREVNGFDRVALSGVGTMFISVGEKESLLIEAEDNLLPYIETKVQGSILEIGLKYEHWNTAIQPTKPINYFLTVTNLEALDLSGAGRIEIEEINTTQLRIHTSGAGDIEIEKLNAQSLTMVVSGAGSCRIHDGKVDSQHLQISGAGGYRASDLESHRTDIDISGMGGAKIWVSDTLHVAISGAGNVGFYGYPTVSQSISGAGRIQSLGDKY